MKACWLFMCVMVSVTAAAGGGEPEITLASLGASLKICSAIGNATERLICYDHIVAAHAAQKLTEPAPTRQDMFGVSGALSRAAEPAESSREDLHFLTARVRGLNRAADQSLLIDLDNGQVWRQEGSVELMLANGDVVTVSRGALSSFRLTTSTGRSARVKRVK